MHTEHKHPVIDLPTEVILAMSEVPQPNRKRLPDTRPSLTHHGVHEAEHSIFEYYVTVGFYDDEDNDEERCRPGEIFVVISKSGSAMRRMVDGWAVAVSLGLQSGVPWEAYAKKYLNGPAPKSIYETLAEAVTYLIDQRRKMILE